MFNLPNHFFGDLLAAFGFGILVILMLIVGYKVIDWALRGVDFDSELCKNNIAVGMVISSIILGICYAMSQVIVAIVGY